MEAARKLRMPAGTPGADPSAATTKATSTTTDSGDVSERLFVVAGGGTVVERAAVQPAERGGCVGRTRRWQRVARGGVDCCSGCGSGGGWALIRPYRMGVRREDVCV